MESLSTTPGRIATLEAQKLLDVSVEGGFAVWLDEHWRDELHALLLSCTEDVRLLTGAPPGPDTAARLLGGMSASGRLEDLFVVGLFDGERRLAGVLVVARDQPRAQEWTVRFLLVRPDQRGRGLAGKMLESLEGWVRSEGGTAILLDAPRTSPGAKGFARRAGFLALEGQPATAIRRLAPAG
jgi:GNAT superfamily N-acetyltransferase